MFEVILLLAVGFCTSTGQFGKPDNSQGGTVGSSSGTGNSKRGLFPDHAFDTGIAETGSLPGDSAFGTSQSTEERKAIQAVFNEWERLMRRGDAAGRDASIRDYWTDGTKCSFPGDFTPNEKPYCATLYKLYYEGLDSDPSRSLIFTHLPDGNTIGEDTATLKMRSRYKGRIPLVNVKVDREMALEVNYVKSDGKWLMSGMIVSGKDEGSFAELKKQALSKALRDAVVSAKQSYPAYNPLIVVGGSALAGFMSIVAVGACLLHRRRAYKKVTTINEV